MTATLDARYRRITEVLEQRGMEVKLLDLCPKCEGHGYREVAVWLADNWAHDVADCGYCDTGTVVPSQAECFWRLLRMAGEKWLCREISLSFWPAHGQTWHITPEWGQQQEAPNLLDALMGAVEQSLGLEKEAKL